MAVTPENIAVALGRTTPDPSSTEYAQWELWIADALMLIDDRLGDTADLDQAKLHYVVREAVVMHVRHPDDVTRVEVAVDDARSSKEYRTGRGRVVILDEWWDLLMPTEASGAFTIDALGWCSMHLPWCSLNFSAGYCSCGVDIAGYPIFEMG
ncbi:MAG: hypothetical protein JWP74_1759 [Marmoricola sp.]|nr:hypothetical protein [Marmoricola sp.]